MGSDKLFQKKKFRSIKELSRQKASKAPYETILIVCEDSKSSPNYFNEIKKYFRLSLANVRVVPSKGSAPISVVEHSIEIAKTTPLIDRVACVFDRDNHASYHQAINKIKDYKPKRSDKSKPVYQAIISTSCFELWILLHFCYTAKSYSYTGNKSAADNLIKDLIKLLPNYSKSVTTWFNDIIGKLNIAIENARRLQEDNNKTNSTNPATNIHELVEYLIKLKNG